MKNIFLGIAVIALLALLFIKMMQPSIEGHWIAEQVIDLPNDTLSIDHSLVTLNIADDRYTFSSTLNQTESGTVLKKGNFLLLSSPEQPSYKVEIESISATQFILIMNTNGKQRKLLLKRSD